MQTKIDDLLYGWKNEMVQKLAEWIQIPSVNAPSEGEGKPFGCEVRRMLEKALGDAAEMGFETENFDGFAGHVQLSAGGGRTMGMLAHLDVVPAGEGWIRDPFGGQVEDGKIFGRGTSDDKGPALAALYAMRAVKEAGIPLKDSVRLILGCDEETGMTDMRHYKSVCKALPDYGFSPDAEYPLINIEKGSVGLSLLAESQGEQGAHIPIFQICAGERRNVVPGKAWAEVGTMHTTAEQMRCELEMLQAERGWKFRVESLENGRARIEAEGISAHASTPEQGLNVMGMLLIALDRLKAGGGIRSAIHTLAEALGVEGDGASLGIAIADEISGALTCNLGVFRFDGNKLEAKLDIRCPICAVPDTICAQAQAKVAGGGVEVKMTDSGKPHHVAEDHPLVQGLLKVYGEVTGLPAYTIAIGGGTYSRMMPDTVAFGCVFPGDEMCAHMPDEYMEIDKLLFSARIMAHAIVELAGE